MAAADAKDGPRCPVTGMGPSDGAGMCPASGFSNVERSFEVGPGASFRVYKSAATGNVFAARTLGQPAADLFLSEAPTKRAVERLTADWDLADVIVGDEWLPEVFVWSLLRFGYLGGAGVVPSRVESELGAFLDLSGDMIFYLKSVWRGAKGAMCVSSTTVLSRMSSDVAASDVGPSGSLMRQRRANGETDADADADVEKLVPVAIANKDQKTLVLTGASRGIGHSTVKTFAMHGYRVITVSRHPFDSNCPWPGGARNHFQWDLGQLDDADEKIAQLRQLIGTGRVEALVCNAGISPKGPGGSRLGALATDLETWHRVLNVNLVSTALLVRGLRDELIAAKGSIVMVTSIAGSRVHPFAGVAYASSKAALAALTREIAKEMAPHAVRCNAISPGEIETSILSPGTDELVAHEVPMRRLGQPSEVAETVLWLCSEKSSYVTGAEIHVNGGQHV